MNITVAIDSFKGSLSSFAAGNAVKEAAMLVDSENNVTVFPIADGGEGTVEAMCKAMDGKIVSLQVSGPLNKKVNAQYAILKDGVTAVIEMSAAAGITLIGEGERNPLYTTTYGVGEIIKDAVLKGCRKFIVGIGGSATNDGGAGMLKALGYRFLDKGGNEIPLGAIGLKNLKEIKTDTVLDELSACSFKIACDVKNPLCGKNGCSAVYGPQKGATQEMIADMDLWLKNYADISKKISPKADASFEGVGAAGGLGFAFLSFTNAVLESGIEIILKEIEIENTIKNSDLVITGEGRLDGQSIMGKAPIGVARLAKKYNKKVIAFSGCVTDDAVLCHNHGIDAFFPILRQVVTLEEALNTDNAYKNLKQTAEQVFRVIKL